jgi:hypothetical protein
VFDDDDVQWDRVATGASAMLGEGALTVTGAGEVGTGVLSPVGVAKMGAGIPMLGGGAVEFYYGITGVPAERAEIITGPVEPILALGGDDMQKVGQAADLGLGFLANPSSVASGTRALGLGGRFGFGLGRASGYAGMAQVGSFSYNLLTPTGTGGGSPLQNAAPDNTDVSTEVSKKGPPIENLPAGN